ncbi:uncharacterized protein LOC142345497 [Convolutriloba macropyga]|uniref:uncharacterized protein LOC142345497 n=1 Tax=Convolutriloba macropyga TaxID=536237 RepID=UPI003F51F5E1
MSAANFGSPVQYDQMVPHGSSSSSFLTTTATTTRVRPRAFVYGISNMFEPPPPSIKQRTLKKPQRPTHLPDIAPTASIPNRNLLLSFKLSSQTAQPNIINNNKQQKWSQGPIQFIVPGRKHPRIVETVEFELRRDKQGYL